MSFSSRDKSFAQLNKNDNTLNSIRRKTTDLSTKNKFKMNFEFQTPKDKKELNKSFSKLKTKKKSLNIKNPEDNIINNYLQFHKFDIQIKKTKRTTLKNQKKNIEKINMNKSNLNINNNNDWASMIYYPSDNKNKKDLINIKNEEKPNLKLIENSIMLKLNSLRNNYGSSKSFGFDKFFDNNIFNNNNETKNSIKNNNQNLNHKKKRSLNSFDIKTTKKNSCINFKRNSYSFLNFKKRKSSHLSSNINNSNYQSNTFKNNKNIKKFNSELFNNFLDKSSSDKTDSKVSIFKAIQNNFKNIKKSSKIFNSAIELKEKSRLLVRIKPLYDSFDDDESDKDINYEGNPILPNNYIIFFLDLFLLLTSIYCLFYIPLRIAKNDCFCSAEYIMNKVLLYFTDLLFIVDFCLGFFRAYYNFEYKLIKNNKRIVFHYLKTDFLSDFLEAIPLYTYINFLCIISKEVNYCFRYDMPNSFIILKMLINLKIFKVFKVRNKRKNVAFSYLFNIFSENYLIEKLIGNFFDISFCFLAFHFFVCLNIYLSKQTYPNWMIINNSQDKPLIDNYILSSYSLIETLTTVGYGDVVCQSNIERIFQIFFLGVGVIAYSYLISSFGNLFKNESQSSINYSNNMRILEEIRVDFPKMPYKLYNKIYNYIESRNMSEKKSDSHILTNSLPFNLKNALLLIMYRADIKNFKIFKNCDNSNFIIQILSNFIPSTSKKSEFLVYEGEMIEDIIIIKDGRLSLEAAINMEDPESSIKNYFNVNFQGITTEKEMRKLKESEKGNISQIIKTGKMSDFDNFKTVLDTIVKKQANHLFNEACDDISILDRTKNDNKNDDIQQEKKIYNVASDYLGHEPIKNEKGNYKYIKIIDIRKNENYGGLYIFMRRPSPLSLKVRSKFAELYLLPKKEVFNIAKNYSNIWSKIHKKDFHNMVSIKHLTFNILNKYIEINGIGKITPNDISKYINPWEDHEKKDKMIKNMGNIKENNYINKNNKKNKQKYSLKCPSPINDKDNNIKNNNKLDLFSGKHISSSLSINNKDQYPLENDFSHLLNMMVAEKKHNIVNTQTNQNLSNRNNNNDNNSKQKKDSSLSFDSNSNFFKNKQKTKCSNEGKTVIIPKNSEKLLPTLNNIFNEQKAEKIKEEMKKTRNKEKRKKLFSFGKKTARIIRNQNYSLFLLDKSSHQCIEIKNNFIFNISNNSLNLNNEKIFDGLNNYFSFCRDNAFLEKISGINSSSEENSFHNFNKIDLSQESIISFSLESIYGNINLHTKMKYSEDKTLQKKTLNYLTKLIENKDSSLSIKSISYNSSEFEPSNSFSYESLYDENLLSFSSSKKIKNNSCSISNILLKNQKNNEPFIDNSNNNKSIKSKKSPRKKKINKIITKTNRKIKFNLDNSFNSKNSDLNKFGNKSLSPKKIKFDAIKSKNIKSSVFNKEDKYIFKIGKVMSERNVIQDNKIASKLKSANNEKNSKNDFFINNKLELGKSPNNCESSVFYKGTNYLNINQLKHNHAKIPDNYINHIRTENFSKSDKKLNLNLTQKESNISDNKSKKSKIKGKYTKKFTKKYTKKKSKKLKLKSDRQIGKFKSEQKLIKIEQKNLENMKESVGYFAQEKKKEDCLII